MTKTYKIALFSILLSIGLVLHLLEPVFVIPGTGFMLKIGISNIVIVYLLFSQGRKQALLLSFFKVLFSLLFSPTVNFSNFLISFGGAILSVLVMTLLYKNKIKRIEFISIMGGIFHNIGQWIVVVLMMRLNISVRIFLYYIPFLICIGALTGYFVGLLSNLVLSKFSNVREKSSYNSN